MSSTRQQPPDAGLIDNMTLGVVRKPVHEAIWAVAAFAHLYAFGDAWPHAHRQELARKALGIVECRRRIHVGQQAVFPFHSPVFRQRADTPTFVITARGALKHPSIIIYYILVQPVGIAAIKFLWCHQVVIHSEATGLE